MTSDQSFETEYANVFKFMNLNKDMYRAEQFIIKWQCHNEYWPVS